MDGCVQWIRVARGQGPHRRKPPTANGDRRLPARDHHAASFPPDDLERIADGVRRRGAGGTSPSWARAEPMETWPAARLMMEAG
jgi:hypothetical protein